MTPEFAMDIQHALGADIVMAFDECTHGKTDRRKSEAAMYRTLRWLERCAKRHEGHDEQMLFPIVQGNMFEDLRVESIKGALEFAKCGFSIGGLSVGEPKEVMYRMLDVLRPLLSRRSAALSDGRRQPRLSDRGDIARHRHVRLRAAHAHGAQRHGVHAVTAI